MAQDVNYEFFKTRTFDENIQQYVYSDKLLCDYDGLTLERSLYNRVIDRYKLTGSLKVLGADFDWLYNMIFGNYLVSLSQEIYLIETYSYSVWNEYIVRLLLNDSGNKFDKPARICEIKCEIVDKYDNYLKNDSFTKEKFYFFRGPNPAFLRPVNMQYFSKLVFPYSIKLENILNGFFHNAETIRFNGAEKYIMVTPLNCYAREDESYNFQGFKKDFDVSVEVGKLLEYIEKCLGLYWTVTTGFTFTLIENFYSELTKLNLTQWYRGQVCELDPVDWTTENITSKETEINTIEYPYMQADFLNIQLLFSRYTQNIQKSTLYDFLFNPLSTLDVTKFSYTYSNGHDFKNGIMLTLATKTNSDLIYSTDFVADGTPEEQNNATIIQYPSSNPPQIGILSNPNGQSTAVRTSNRSIQATQGDRYFYEGERVNFTITNLAETGATDLHFDIYRQKLTSTGDAIIDFELIQSTQLFEVAGQPTTIEFSCDNFKDVQDSRGKHKYYYAIVGTVSGSVSISVSTSIEKMIINTANGIENGGIWNGELSLCRQPFYSYDNPDKIVKINGEQYTLEDYRVKKRRKLVLTKPVQSLISVYNFNEYIEIDGLTSNAELQSVKRSMKTDSREEITILY